MKNYIEKRYPLGSILKTLKENSFTGSQLFSSETMLTNRALKIPEALPQFNPEN